MQRYIYSIVTLVTYLPPIDIFGRRTKNNKNKKRNRNLLKKTTKSSN